jgi:hypothetical protein
MQQFYGDERASSADDDIHRLIQSNLRRIASATVFVTLVAGMGIWAYRLGTRDAAEVPIVRAMEGPARIQPEAPGGFQAAHQGNEVNSVLEGAPAPVPRDGGSPLPTPVALIDEDGPQGTLIRAAPAALVREALGVADGIELQAPSEEAELVEPAPDMTAGDGAATELAPLPDEAEEAALASPAAEAGPRRRPSGLAPRPAAQAKAPAPATPAVREVSGLSSGARLVQLGAFDSEEITRSAWSRLLARHGDLLGGKSLYVERTTGNARVFYRLRVAGFDSTDQTRDMCEALRARGVDCIPVTLQ